MFKVLYLAYGLIQNLPPRSSQPSEGNTNIKVKVQCDKNDT